MLIYRLSHLRGDTTLTKELLNYTLIQIALLELSYVSHTQKECTEVIKITLK